MLNARFTYPVSESELTHSDTGASISQLFTRCGDASPAQVAYPSVRFLDLEVAQPPDYWHPEYSMGKVANVPAQ